MTAQETTLIDVLEGRRATYQLLTRFFRTEVDEAFLAALRETRFPAHTGEASMDRGHRLVVSYLSHADADVLSDLARDFSGTFIGSGNDAYSAAYPFEPATRCSCSTALPAWKSWRVRKRARITFPLSWSS